MPDLTIYGDPVDAGARRQIERCLDERGAVAGALMADHHLGYSMPIGGVVAYEGRVSPSGAGFDLACGNKAVRLGARGEEVRAEIAGIMDAVWEQIRFGVGRTNPDAPDHELFDDPAWRLPPVAALYDKARAQLGTVGSGNHYVDIFTDERDEVWVGVHFGSRGLGHGIATHYLAVAGGQDGFHAPPAMLDVGTASGDDYVAAMRLAGRYAYAGRDWVCERVAEIIGAPILEEVHNHHNFAWLEQHEGRDLWVIRKGATPAWPGQRGFIGGSMAEEAVLVEGVESEASTSTLHSTVHGAGRVMSRSAAKGRWKYDKKAGKLVCKRPGLVSPEMMMGEVERAGVELRGGGLDEAPQAYKRLDEVLAQHADSIRITHRLTPIGVAMAGPERWG